MENTNSHTPATTDHAASLSEVQPTEKILISNIGNTSLMYRGKYIPIEFFKTLTHEYLQNLGEHRSFLQVEILKNHLQGISRAYLFATDQTDPDRNYQDTIHAANLLKELLLERYGVPASVVVLHGNPTDENALTARFAPVIQKMREFHPQAHFYLNLAGGTSQMKTVVRELLCYHLPPNHRTFRYSDRQDEVVAQVQRQYVERYVLLAMARQFVNQYDYAAALSVLGQLPAGGKAHPHLQRCLRIAKLRQEFNLQEAQMLAAKADALPSALTEYVQKHLPTDAALPEGFNRPDDRRKIFEIASLSQLFFRQEKYALAVLSFYRMMEEIGQAVAETLLQVSVSHRSGQQRFLEELTTGNLLAAYPQMNIPKYGVPSLLVFGLEHPAVTPDVRLVFQLLKPMCSLVNGDPYKGLNRLRNQCFLTHDDQPVRAQDLDREIPGFMIEQLYQKVFSALGLPSENLYDRMNRELELLFLQE